MTTSYQQAGAAARNYILRLYNRQSLRTLDITACVESVTWTTYRRGQPAALTFSALKTAGMAFWEGDEIAFYVDGQQLFKGYVFTKEKDQHGQLSVTCYDLLRYLRARQSYNFSGYCLEQIIQKIAADFALPCGSLATTGYQIPALLADDKTCLDTIFNALELTTAATGKDYQFHAENGALVLRSAAEMVSPYILAEDSFTTGYHYRTSIDEDVYNYVKLVRPTETTGRGEAYVAKANDNIARWGVLQLYQKVSEELNAAQIKSMAKSLLNQYNRLQRRLTISCLGVPSLRAGQIVHLDLPDIGEMSLNQQLVATEVVQRFTPRSHTMDLTFVIQRQDEGDFRVTESVSQEYLDHTVRSSSSSKGSSGSGNSGGGNSGKSDGYRQPYHSAYRLSTAFGVAGSSWRCGWHTGTDYVGIGNKKIYAIAAGKVTKVSVNGSYGRHVYVTHYDGYVSLYAHLSQVSVSAGQTVTINTQIGVEGATGNASGSHLHLELHKGAYQYPPSPRINPYLYIEQHLAK